MARYRRLAYIPGMIAFAHQQDNVMVTVALIVGTCVDDEPISNLVRVVQMPAPPVVEMSIEIHPGQTLPVQELSWSPTRPNWIEAIMEDVPFDDSEDEYTYAAAMEQNGWWDIADCGIEKMYDMHFSSEDDGHL